MGMLEIAIVAGILSVVGAGVTLTRRRNKSAPDPANESEEPTRRNLDDGLRRNDVLLYAGREYWLSDVLRWEDGAERWSLFRAPQNEGSSWLLEDRVRPEEVVLLQSLTSLPAGRIASEVYADGRHYRLHRCGRIEVESSGESPLFATGTALEYTLLRSGSAYMIVVLDSPDGTRLSLQGECLESSLFEVLPGATHTE